MLRPGVYRKVVSSVLISGRNRLALTLDCGHGAIRLGSRVGATAHCEICTAIKVKADREARKVERENRRATEPYRDWREVLRDLVGAMGVSVVFEALAELEKGGAR
jgi:hypothetical protein